MLGLGKILPMQKNSQTGNGFKASPLKRSHTNPKIAPGKNLTKQPVISQLRRIGWRTIQLLLDLNNDLTSLIRLLKEKGGKKIMASNP